MELDCLNDIVLLDNELPDELVVAMMLALSANGRKLLVVPRSSISAILKSSNTRSYAILTGKPALLADFIPNNVVDVTGKTFGQIAKHANWILSSYSTEKSSSIFFISDTHFNHRNIIKYCNRPWSSGKDENGESAVSDTDVEAMNEAIIAAWNSTVPKDATVWHLGDFALGDRSKIPELVSRLNGKINLVLGNHDHRNIRKLLDAGFNAVYDHPVLIDKHVILTHEPLEFLNDNCPFFQIFGHVHDSAHYSTWSKNGACVCVERHGYKPVSFEEIKEKARALREE